MNATIEQAVALGSLTGRAALVTGATSGIGRAAAIALGRSGAFVLVTGRNAERGAETVAEIESGGGRAAFQTLDVTRANDWDVAVSRIERDLRRLDILINNAGGIGFAPLEKAPVESLHDFARLNLESAFIGISRAWPMLKKRGGAVINIVSTAGQGGIGNAVAYTASKGGLTGLTKAAARDGAKYGIRVNSIHPGAVWTEGLARMMNDTLEGYTAKMRQSGATPIGRPALPADLAAAIVFLASDAGRGITGAEFNIDGGLRAR